MYTSLARWNIEKFKTMKQEIVRPAMDEGDWRYNNWLHYVTVMPNVVAWTRAELSRLLSLRDSTRRARLSKAKPKRR